MMSRSLFRKYTPGRVGININSGDGGSPVLGTIISQNVIRDEDVDIAVNTPAEVDSTICSATKSASPMFVRSTKPPCAPAQSMQPENYWGCPRGPNKDGCTTQRIRYLFHALASQICCGRGARPRKRRSQFRPRRAA